MATTVSPEFLVPEEVFLTSGVHIGTQQKSANMRQFIFKVRTDGLYVLDIKKTNERIKTAATFISRFDPARTLIVSARQYGQKPVRMFAQVLGTQVVAGRFRPGIMTNPRLSEFVEPDILVVTDPAADAQALREAINIGIPVVGLCDANNETKNIDLIIPANNKGRRSLSVVYWLLTREVMKARGMIQTNEEYQFKPEEFEATL